MKSINAKRIAAVAASLLVGLAAAGQGVNFGNIPIINTAGQPVVQIVVGSSAQPSDGVVAANIAAVIGSLAHTSTTITATVSGRNGVSCVVTTPTCTLSNQQVWLGEQGLVVPTGSYSFSALIGSVLNPGVLNSGNLKFTKYENTTTNTNYAYPEASTAPYTITSTPTATSVYAGIGISPYTTVSSSTNGGGVSFSRFSSNSLDSVLQLGSSQVPGLLSSSGITQETENLWLAGFPVYNQNSGSLSVLDTNGAYQISFGKPITNTTTNRSSGEPISLLGQNWTVYNLNPPSSMSGVSSSKFILGGNVTLAQASTKPTIVYVGQNITSGPFKVVLNDLSYPNSSGIANAALSVYKNGVLTNVTSVGPAGGTKNENVEINASGTKLFIAVTQTFPGLYAYQKWAKIQLFSDTVNVSSGKDFNAANGKGWLAALRWTTNQSASAGELDSNAALQGIILYSNQSNSVTLTPGSSFQYITSPAVWNVNFAGDALGAPSSGNSNYDPLVFATSSPGSTYQYANPNGGAAESSTQYNFVANVLTTANIPVTNGAGPTVNTTTVTEPVNLFTVSSSIPTAFQLGTGSSPAPTSNINNVTYNLDPYTYVVGNSVTSAGAANVLGNANGGIVVQLSGVGSIPTNAVGSNNNLNVQVTGYKAGATSTSQTTATFTTSAATQNYLIPGFVLANVIDVSLSYAIPNPGVTVQVYETGNVGDFGSLSSAGATANAVLMGTLSAEGSSSLLYKVPQYSYYQAPTAPTVTYTGEGNNVNFAISSVHTGATTSRNQYYTYTVPEITTPSTTSPTANVIIGITNSSSVDGSPAYWLNVTGGNNQALEYQTTQPGQSQTTVKALQGFRTERGGEVSSISTSQVVYDEPRSVDGLQFIVGPVTNTASNTLQTTLHGPYTVGQATNIANVTIGKVNATCAFSTTSCNVTGLNNLTAVPSVSQAIVPTVLNTAVTPLAVLDSNANQATTLIVVGSKYVNSVAAQIFAQNPSFNSTFNQGTSGPDAVNVKAFGTNRILVAGYSANQTVTAGNQFISDLLANATS